MKPPKPLFCDRCGLPLTQGEYLRATRSNGRLVPQKQGAYRMHKRQAWCASRNAQSLDPPPAAGGQEAQL